MLGRLIALVVLATVAFVAWNRGWTIDEAQVRQFYDRQLVAFRDFDHEAMCKDLAGDYRARLALRHFVWNPTVTMLPWLLSPVGMCAGRFSACAHVHEACLIRRMSPWALP